VTRTYTSDMDRRFISGSFGRGWKSGFDIRITGNFVIGGAGRLVSPEQESGDLFSYVGTDSDGALLFASTGSISQLGDVLRKLSNGTFEYRLRRGKTMRFNSAGRLTGLVDPNGNTTTFSYSGSNLTSITDAVGRLITIEYDLSSRITKITDPLNRIWRYTYESGLLTTVTDPLGGVTRYAYGPFPNGLRTVTDKRGTIDKLITYNASGRVTSQQFADGGIELYDYTLAGTLVTSTTITDTRGNKRTFRFNGSGYVVETVDNLGQRAQINRDLTTNTALSTTGPCGCTETTKQYDARGNVISATDRVGDQTKIEYEPVFNRASKIIDRLGRTVSFTYDPNGNLSTMTDPLNQTTTNVYDSFGQLTNVTDSLGHTQQTEYDAFGNISAVIDPLGNRTTLEHDGVGRLTAEIDALGRRSATQYDALDRIISTTDPAGAISLYFYDANDNLVKVTDVLGRSWTAVYDSKNRLISSTDALGRRYRKSYDTADQVTTTISPSGRTVRNTYDERGDLATMTDALGNIVKYQSDSRGNLIRMTDPRGFVTTYLYDQLFRSIGMRDPLGRSSNISYDAADNVSETVDRLGRRVNYTYDAGDRITHITYADAVVGYTYDAASRVTRIDDTQSGSAQWTFDNADRMLSETTANGVVSYAYNQANQMTSMTAADRSPVTYAYDAAGRLQTISQGTESFTYSYDALSRPATLQRPNGVRTSYTFDGVDRLTRLTHANGLNQLIEDYVYTYTADDQIESMSSLASSTQLPQAKNVGTADAANRTPQHGDSTYSFDERGMTTSKTNAQGTTAYQWDARGRLTQVALPSGQVVNYGYDATGRLSSRTANSATTSFLYNGSEVVLDRVSDGTQVDYLNGIGTDNKLRQASSATGTLYFLQDQLGSTTALTGPSGNVVELKQYEPFGDSQNSSFTRYTYSGRDRDSSTDLMYYRARWYDPQQGRFLSEDPIGYSGGLNLYAYVNNDPVNFRDPQGLWPSAGPRQVHQAIINRALAGRATPNQLRILMQEQKDFDADTQAEAYAHMHAMRRRGESREDARRKANRFVRGEICLARELAAKGHHAEAMRRLSRAMHTVQDATSPAHANFAVAWEDTIPQMINHLPHYLVEDFDPGSGSAADRATGKIWDYFIGNRPLPDDFFNGEYDLKYGRAFFDDKPAPDRTDGCPCP